MANFIRTLFTIFAFLSLVGCEYFSSESRTWRQKVTVEVMTPNGVVKGSGVIQVTYRYGHNDISLGKGVSRQMRGEPIVILLDDGRKLFALLKSNFSASLVSRYVWITALKNAQSKPLVWPTWVDSELANDEPQLIPEENYPVFAYFVDLKDPNTLVTIRADELAQHLGAEYFVQSVSYEISNKKVDKGKIAEHLPWLSDRKFVRGLWPDLKPGQRETINDLRF